jgi:hypothetical protein
MSKNPHDPANYMGIWTAIHILGKTGVPGHKVQFPENVIIPAEHFFGLAIQSIALGLGCVHGCVEHAKQFLIKDPFHKVKGDEYALFDWTVRFHNHANVITGKPEMSIEDARKLYYKTSSVCSIAATDIILTRSSR